MYFMPPNNHPPRWLTTAGLFFIALAIMSTGFVS